MDIRYSFKIISICKNQKIDIIHIHDPICLALITIADKFYNLPPFVFSKKTSFPIKDKKLTLYKYNYKKIKKYLCVSNFTKQITAKSIIAKEKLITIYHGTNLDAKSSETPFIIRDKFSISKDKKIVGIIGNHIEAKDLITFVKVVNEIIFVKKRKDIVFVQIGSFTKLTDSILKLVENYQLKNYIHFLNYQPKASNFIPQFDIMIMTSQSEGIPQAIYESFYHKVPVISTDVGGIPEIIVDGENGYLLSSGDYKSFSDRIETLLNDEEIARKFTALSYDKLISNYTTQSMALKTLEQYKLVINGSKF
jgi:glycosyltransferase involved in cell wall biosynthesis